MSGSRISLGQGSGGGGQFSPLSFDIYLAFKRGEGG